MAEIRFLLVTSRVSPKYGVDVSISHKTEGVIHSSHTYATTPKSRMRLERWLNSHEHEVILEGLRISIHAVTVKG